MLRASPTRTGSTGWQGCAVSSFPHMSGGSGLGRTIPSFSALIQYWTGMGRLDAEAKAAAARLRVGAAGGCGSWVCLTVPLHARQLPRLHRLWDRPDRARAMDVSRCPPRSCFLHHIASRCHRVQKNGTSFTTRPTPKAAITSAAASPSTRCKGTIAPPWPAL